MPFVASDKNRMCTDESSAVRCETHPGHDCAVVRGRGDRLRCRKNRVRKDIPSVFCERGLQTVAS